PDPEDLVDGQERRRLVTPAAPGDQRHGQPGGCGKPEVDVNRWRQRSQPQPHDLREPEVSENTQTTRIYFTGDCEGFANLRGSLEDRPDLEVVGWSEHVAQASGALAGGHLDCVLHGTREASFPAAAFAKHIQKRTLLLDLDLQFGDAAIAMGLEPEKTIFDLVVAPGELDFEKLTGYTTKHPCGLDILPAPMRPEDAELVTESKITRL